MWGCNDKFRSVITGERGTASVKVSAARIRQGGRAGGDQETSEMNPSDGTTREFALNHIFHVVSRSDVLNIVRQRAAERLSKDDDTLYTHGQQQPTHYGNDTCASIRINILMDTWEGMAGCSEIEKLLIGSAYQSSRTKQTINFNEQSERFRFLHFGGLLLAEDKGSFVGPNLTKGPIGPVHSSTTRATRLLSLLALPSVYASGINKQNAEGARGPLNVNIHASGTDDIFLFLLSRRCLSPLNSKFSSRGKDAKQLQKESRLCKFSIYLNEITLAVRTNSIARLPITRRTLSGVNSAGPQWDSNKFNGRARRAGGRPGGGGTTRSTGLHGWRSENAFYSPPLPTPPRRGERQVSVGLEGDDRVYPRASVR
ncbi:hypothetical protein ALC62_11252 [Cyphomyrmex costatus]|uniref:Uncharacterized protein n=1 Tax=Cyphomyrmex costatus TaxID=456900 RepID=A0A195CCE8_9HYME|nr:hypothetical protein ALC62_11252 [Cyphomyrmex costatus]